MRWSDEHLRCFPVVLQLEPTCELKEADKQLRWWFVSPVAEG